MTKKSISLIKIGRPPAFRIAYELLWEIFSNVLTAFSAISINSKFCIFSQRIVTPPCFTIISDKLGAISKILDKAEAE